LCHNHYSRTALRRSAISSLKILFSLAEQQSQSKYYPVFFLPLTTK